MKERLRQHRGLLLLLLAYLGTGLWMVWRLPGFSGPNEALHYEHVALLRRDLRLPDAAASKRSDERHQPPVYYSLAALAGWRHAEPPLDTDFAGNPHYLSTPRGNLNPKLGVDPSSAPLLYSARLTSLAFGLLGILATYWAASLFVSTGTALLVATLLAFHPGWLHLSVTAANDLPAAAMSALALAWASRLLLAIPLLERAAAAGLTSHPERPGPIPWHLHRRILDARGLGGLLWGLAFALAVLTKANAVFLALTWVPVCLWLWRRQGFASCLRAGLVSLLGFLPFALAWILLNRARGLDATGVERSVPLDRLTSLRPLDLAELWPHLGQIWRSVWLDWSRGDVGHAPDLVYWGIAAILMLAAAGWLRQGLSSVAEIESAASSPLNDRGALRPALTMHLGWTLIFSLFYLGVKTLMVKETGFLTAEGRWILPLAPSLAWLAGLGLEGLAPAGRRTAWAQGLAATLTLLGVGLAAWLVPHLYPMARELAQRQALSDDARGLGIVYAEALELLEAIEGEALIAGRDADLALRWRVLAEPAADYSISTQLLLPLTGGGWRKLEERASYPGLGTAATGDWRAGQRFRDPISLRPEAGAEDGPVRARLAVFLVEEAGAGASLPMTHQGQAADILAMPQVVLQPAGAITIPVEARLASPARFGSAVELLGLDWRQSGDSGSDLVLYWKVLAPLASDHTVFVHLLDPDGNRLAQADGDPLAGASPPAIWQAGDLLRDRRHLGEAPGPGASLLLGFYSRESGARLEARQAGTRLPDDAYRFDYALDPGP